MGESQRSPTTDFYSIFGIPKAMCKTYKFVTKWNSDKSPNKKENEAEARFEERFEAYKQAMKAKHQREKQTNNDEPTTPVGFHSRSIDDSFFSRPSFVSKCTSRRSHTPTPRSSYISKIGSRRSSPISFVTRSTSKKVCTMSESESGSRRGSNSESECGSRRASTPENSNRSCTSETDQNNPSISRSVSRRGPIIFSQTTAARRKPPPVERKLSCTLEELCLGGVKKIMIKREITSEDGIIREEEELLRIKLKPGWKTGTKITFEGKGDKKPGYLPVDIIFSIDEKRHPLFRREGDDLEIIVEIPLVQALTGFNLSVPLLGGESMNLTFEDTIIYPGFEKVIEGQGMPNPKADGKRGDLRLRFLVEFPQDLSDEQRSEAFNILQDCS